MFGWQEGNAAIKFSCRMRTEFGKGDSGEMKLLVFGTGEYYQRFKKWLVKEDIVALLDNSPAKQNTVIDGHEVLSPKDGIEREYDAVIVMSFYIKAMRKQLIELGVSSESIYHFYDLRKLIDLKRNKQKVQFYGNIALLSTDLALGGTAIALFQMAKVLKQIGYPIVFASMMDGPLKEWLEECGIPVIIDPNLQLATMREIEWLSDFRLIICNAVNYYLFLSERDLGIPMVWWLHDSSFFYDGVDKEILQKISTENLTVLAVGPIPEKSIHLIVPKLPVGQLLYGVEDIVGREGSSQRTHAERRNTQGKICFVTIGHIEERKGQDILLQAVSLLKKEERQKAVFYLVGQDTSLLAGQVKEKAVCMPEIVITGPVGREKVAEILDCADVMVCPSREDPMPTVAAEAMMYSVPCILSNAAGTAAYITEGENGFVFPNGDVWELVKKLSWCIENRSRLAQMGGEARRVYEENFSMDVFEANVRQVVERVL